MAWVDLTVFAGNPTKAIEANTIQANITAQANGDPGAPKNTLASMAANSVGFSQMTDNSIGQAEMRDSAIGQSELRTSNGSVSYIVSINSVAELKANTIVLPGGQYGFYPNILLATNDLVGPGDFDANSPYFAAQLFSEWQFDVAAPLAATISLIGFAGARPELDGTITAQQRYMTASPPYNLGNGDCSHFIFVKLASNGDIISTYSAGAPPWAYNGPTDIRPDEVVTKNKKVRKYKNVLVSKPAPPWEGGDIDLWEKGPVYKKREIDHDLKNADMSLIPHPFGPLKPGERVVMVDPCGKLADTASPIEESGEALSGAIADGFVKLGDELDCNKPDGVIVVSADWKRSK